VRKVLKAEDVWVPYDEKFPERVIPDSLQGLNVDRWLLAAGWGMTFRREICLKEPFESVMVRYTAGEDSDMSYRASRHGIYLVALDALLCHIGSTGGRIPGYVVAALYGMNPLVLHVLHSTDRARSKHKLRAFLRRRIALNFAKDVYYRRWSLPHARGTMFALSMLDQIFAKSEETLRKWYPEFQRELIEAHTPPST
jgi:hypothetical protein